MSVKVGDKALSRDWEKISAYRFKITEDMIIEFQGRLCNIQDSERNLVESLDIKYNRIPREVLAGYRYFVIKL